jgi:hypothetical protein
MYARTKTVTRRMGWDSLKAGDKILAVEKGMGLKKGEKSIPIYPIVIVSVKKEPLNKVTLKEVELEGFDGQSIDWFIDMFCKSHKGCTPTSVVSRIEFKEVKE